MRGRGLKRRLGLEVGVGHQAQEPPPHRGRGLKPSAGTAGAIGARVAPQPRGVDGHSVTRMAEECATNESWMRLRGHTAARSP